MKWIRKKSYKEKLEKYHLDYHEHPSQDMHYLFTKCRCQIKGIYNQWDLKEDPEKSECCIKCMNISGDIL